MIPCIHFSVNHEPLVLAKLLVNIKPRLYLSYNMTGLEASAFSNVERFYRKLRKYFVVPDQVLLEIGSILVVIMKLMRRGKKPIQ